MNWEISPDGVATAVAGGIAFELIPCPGVVFGLEHCKETARHLARMQAAGAGWADGTTCKIAYRVEPEGAKPRKPLGKRSVTR